MPQRSSKGALVLGGRTGPVVSRMVHASNTANGGAKGGDTGKSWDDEDVRLVFERPYISHLAQSAIFITSVKMMLEVATSPIRPSL
jgi:hypothetical protein